MKTTASLILCLVGTIATAADVSSASSEARSVVARTGVPLKPRHLAPGDKIQMTINVTTAREVTSVQSADLVIAADGKTEVPELGRIQTAGLTLRELSRDIERRFTERRGKDGIATVMISRAYTGSRSFQSAAAAGRLKKQGDSQPELLDAPGPQYRDLR